LSNKGGILDGKRGKEINWGGWLEIKGKTNKVIRYETKGGGTGVGERRVSRAKLQAPAFPGETR